VIGEPVLVHDRRPALLERPDVRDQRGGVHRHEHVRVVARGEDVTRGEVDLEGRDPVGRTRGGADLGREVGKRGEVVSHHRRGVGEAAAGELHTVARVARKADDYTI
jgi:hypothetical protein